MTRSAAKLRARHTTAKCARPLHWSETMEMDDFDTEIRGPITESLTPIPAAVTDRSVMVCDELDTAPFVLATMDDMDAVPEAIQATPPKPFTRLTPRRAFGTVSPDAVARATARAKTEPRVAAVYSAVQADAANDEDVAIRPRRPSDEWFWTDSNLFVKPM